MMPRIDKEAEVMSTYSTVQYVVHDAGRHSEVKLVLVENVGKKSVG